MNDVKCLLPWVELNLTAQGQARMCCANAGISSHEVQYSFADERLDFDFQRRRRASGTIRLFSGRTNLGCQACIRAESSGPSYRTFQSPLWEHHREVTRRDVEAGGELPIRYLDLRFSNFSNFCNFCNFCNFACRLCDSTNSHKWIHYLVLEELLRQGRTDIRLRYNSNLSTLSYRGHDVLELWSRFKDVKVFPSFESIGTRAEYIRVGTMWSVIEENVRRSLSYLGAFNCVLSADNFFSILDLLKWANGLGKPDTIFPADNPPEISVAILPLEVRNRAIENYRRFQDEELPVSGTVSDEQHGRIEAAILAFSKTLDPLGAKAFAHFKRYFDQQHGTDFLSTFPEHRSWHEALD